MNNQETPYWLIHLFNEPVYNIYEPAPDLGFMEDDDTQKVSVETEPPTESGKDDLKKPDWMGQPEAEVAILVNYPNKQYLAEEDQEFLTNILKAINLNWNKARLLNVANIAFSEFLAEEKPGIYYLLSFGVDLTNIITQADTTLSYYSSQYISNINVLMAEDLQTIQQERRKKGQLWNALKEMFKIS